MASTKGFGICLLALCVSLTTGFAMDFLQGSNCVKLFQGTCQIGIFDICPAGYERYDGLGVYNFGHCYGFGLCCVLVDPCVTSTCSDNAICEADGATYTCACKPGFDGNAYGSVCNDINECTAGSHLCGAGADCNNFDGGHICSCPPGYNGDPYDACLDINECLPTSPCPSGEICNNVDGSYSCSCPDGYERDFSSNCIDIDECAAGTDQCSDFASCENTVGSYTCTCDNGYTGDGRTCTDMDECALGIDVCVDNADCIDNDGSYTCQCSVGYAGDGYVLCYPTNECADPSLNDCAANAVCTDTAISYTCECADGYTGIGNVACTNEDECMAGTHTCSINAVCTDNVGSYTCACKDGYTGDGFTCTQIDECALNLHTCVTNAVCSDTVGSFDCACADGYSGDGFVSCTNVDECALGTHGCSALATCADNDGSFTCTCDPGYSGDGFTCSNINECVEETHNCSTNAVCTDAVPFFTCQCQDGYYGDGYTCVASLNHPMCGLVLTNRIGAGLQTEACKNPWHVHIRSFMTAGWYYQDMLPLGGNSFGIGSGILIQDKWVLTNSWPLVQSKRLPNFPTFDLSLFVVAGDNDLSVEEGTEQYIRVKNVVFHDQGSFEIGDNLWTLVTTNEVDLDNLTDTQLAYPFALIELETPVTIDNCVRPACLPMESEYPDTCAKENCRFTGWGENVEHNTLPILQKGEVELFDATTCRNLHYYLNGGTDTVLPVTAQCALSPDGSVPCNADNGGPLVCQEPDSTRFVVEGVNLVKYRDCQPSTRLPFLVSRARDAMDWIVATIKPGK